MLKDYYGSIAFTIVALAAGAAYGWFGQGSVAAAMNILWICAVLSVLEISLSFDNAVVNATTLKTMDPVWQRRFLTWGIIIAVFGMRVVFPILIVAVFGNLGPAEAVRLSFSNPDEYARIVSSAHTGIMGFGGAFLMLVGLRFFFDSSKEHHWIDVFERPLKRFANLQSVEIFIVLLLAFAIQGALPAADGQTFFISAFFGCFTYFAVEWIGNVLESAQDVTTGAAKSGLAAFLYLEVLDASFSFDGVIGAFALTTNLIVIALGLGIGAMFVRSMTIALVNAGTLGRYLYLEHGAFWAILALAGIMFASVLVHIPESVTGLLGAGLIGLSLMSSVRLNRANGV